MAKRILKAGNAFTSLSISIDDERIQVPLTKLAQALQDFRRFWSEYFAPQFFQDVQDNMTAEGRMVGGWRALSPKYAAWKLRKYGPKPILQATGAMKRSLQLGGPGNVMRVTRAKAIFGTTDRKAPFHNRGAGRLPKRKLLYFRSMRVYSRLLAEFVRDEMRKAGLKNARVVHRA